MDLTAPDTRLPPPPAHGRRFVSTRKVRFGDTDPTGRLRLDALARMLQDVGTDDLVDAGLDGAAPWVARRAVVAATRWPTLGEKLTVTTFCSGLASRWAERRSSIAGDGGGGVEAAAVWVFVDPMSGRPARLPDWFLDTYAGAAGGRGADARHHHARPVGTETARPWPLRVTDLDVLGHVNNAMAWAAVEDECARRRMVPGRVEIEYGPAIELENDVSLLSAAGPDELAMWLMVEGAVRVSATVAPATRQA